MTRILLFMVSCVFTYNLVFVRMLGVSSIMDDSHSIEAAAGIGLLVTVIMTASSAVNWLLYNVILVPLKAQFLIAPVFVLVIALMAMASATLFGDKLYGAKDSLTLLTAACALLGASVVNVESGNNLGYGLISGLFSGLGFLVAMVLMAGVQERIRFSNIPEPMKGFPITLISASLMALAFMGFMGIA